MKLNFYFLIFVSVLMMVTLVSAQETNLNQIARGDEIRLIQTCGNCSFVNISSVLYPNKSLMISNIEMIENGFEYSYILEGNYTNDIGTYIVNTLADVDGEILPFPYTFEVTPSGSSPLSSGQGTILFVAMLVILTLALVFLFSAWAFQSTTAKAIFLTLGAIMILILVLYTLLILNEAIAGSPSLVEGFENFYFIVRILVTLGFVALMIFIVLVMARAWKIKRGLVDD